jgi:hypothetical protein
MALAFSRLSADNIRSVNASSVPLPAEAILSEQESSGPIWLSLKDWRPLLMGRFAQWAG